VQSALRGDIAPQQALQDINITVERANQLANQMLALAKVEQLRHQADAPVLDLASVVRDVALDLAPLIADKQLDFDLDTQPAPVRSHPWALRELTRNLLHNAIKHDPEGQPLRIQVRRLANEVELLIADSGPGLSADLQQRLFQPFSAGDHHSGSGLGLAICHEIVASLNGSIRLETRHSAGLAVGLDARVRLPLANGSDIDGEIDSDDHPASTGMSPA
jgi:two-component system sensor histidine kinase TctE